MTNQNAAPLKPLIPKSGSTSAKSELHRIGDAVASRSIHAAALDEIRLCQVM
jgi:hypothetical protein